MQGDFHNQNDCASVWVKVDGPGKWYDPHDTVTSFAGSGPSSYGFTNVIKKLVYFLLSVLTDL